MMSHKANHKKALSKPVFVILMACIAIIVVYFANLFLAHLYAKNINNLISNTNTQIAATQDFINEAIDPNNPNAQLQNQDVFYARQMAANKEQVVIIQNALQKAQKTPYALGVGNLKKITVSYFTNLLNYTQQQNNLNSYETSLSKISQDLSLLTQVNDTSVNGLISKFTNYQSVFDIDLSSSGIDLKTQNTQAKQILTNIINSLNNINSAINAQDIDKFNSEQASLITYSENLKNIISQNLQTIINTNNNSLSDLSDQIQAQYQQIQDAINKINKNFFYIPPAKAWNDANYYLDNFCIRSLKQQWRCDTNKMTVTRTDLVAYPEYLPSYVNSYGENIRNGAYAPGPGFPVLAKINSDDPVLYAKTGSFNNWQTLTDADVASGGDLSPIDGKSGIVRINDNDTLNRATTIVHTNIEPNTTYVYMNPASSTSNLYVSSMHFAKNNSNVGVGWYLAVNGDNQPKVFVTQDGGKTILMTNIYITSNSSYAPKLSDDGSSLYTCWAAFGGAPSDSGCTKWDNFDYLAGTTVGTTISPQEYNNFQDGALLTNVKKSVPIIQLYVVTAGNVDIAKDQYLHIDNRNFKIKNNYSNIPGSHSPWFCWSDCYKYYNVNFNQDFIMTGVSLLTQDSGWINIQANQISLINKSVIDASGTWNEGIEVNCGAPSNATGNGCASTSCGTKICLKKGSGGGGAHGGDGGPGRTWDGVTTWGSQAKATDPVSNPKIMPQLLGGGRGGYNDHIWDVSTAYGGGIIQLKSNNDISVANGSSIKANGLNGDVNSSGGGAGAGGTIILDALSVYNSGLIAAKGGNGNAPILNGNAQAPSQEPGGGGGGGTMAFLTNYNDGQDPNEDTQHVSVDGGIGGENFLDFQHGGIGWIYYKPKPSYTMTIAPDSQKTARGHAVDYYVNIINANGFQGTVDLTPDNYSDIGISLENSHFDFVNKGDDTTQSTKMTVTPSSTISSGNHTIKVNGVGSFNGRTINKDATAILNIVNFAIFGDIFAKKQIGNLFLGAGSVATAGGSININGTDYRISSYSNPSNLLIWSNIYSKMSSTKNTLSKQQRTAALNTSQISDLFVLDSDNSSGAGNAGQYPDGKVWVKNGDLTINAATFSGKGTIIVNGNVNITGSIDYANDKSSLGIIANNITIGPNVTNLVGSYYAAQDHDNGKITINSPVNPATFNVIMAAHDISFSNINPELTIEYNQAQAQNPPPGFQNLVMPTYSEVSP